MTFTLPGFQTVVRGGVAVGAGATATVDVEMAVEPVSRMRTRDDEGGKLA